MCHIQTSWIDFHHCPIWMMCFNFEILNVCKNSDLLTFNLAAFSVIPVTSSALPFYPILLLIYCYEVWLFFPIHNHLMACKQLISILINSMTEVVFTCFAERSTSAFRPDIKSWLFASRVTPTLLLRKQFNLFKIKNPEQIDLLI